MTKQETDSLTAAKAHMDSCRALLHVPDDETLYVAIEALIAQRDEAWQANKNQMTVIDNQDARCAALSEGLTGAVVAFQSIAEYWNGATESAVDAAEEHILRAKAAIIVAQSALAPDSGNKFLAERDRLRDLIDYVRENVTVEIAAHGDCQCDIPAGDTPCVYCASIHFNERTTKAALKGETTE